MIKGIDHVAIAVGDIDEAIKLFENILGLKVTHVEDLQAHGVKAATISVGNTDIELVQGTSSDSAITRFVEKKGPGIHHIALAVDDIVAAIESLQKKAVEMIDSEPRTGKDESKVAFVHPRSTNRILFELVQPKDDD